jgi:hypothetical protein
MPQPRNSWKLCAKHSNCGKCKYTLKCWQNKATKHAYKAQALKHTLDCILDDRSITTVVNDLIVLATLECNRPKDGELLSKCGICMEKYSVGGENNMTAFGCGHTVCISCAKSLTKADCPYCRKEITKAIVLYYEKADPED